MRIVLSLLGALAMICTSAQAPASAVAPVLLDIAPQLVGHTGVPVYLPDSLPSRADLFAQVIAVSFTSYVVEIDKDTGCDNRECQYGGVAAYAQADPEYPQLTGTKQTLSNGQVVYFTSVSCGGRCEDDTLAFDRDGFRYVVGMRASTLQTISQIVLSMQGPLPHLNGLNS